MRSGIAIVFDAGVPSDLTGSGGLWFPADSAVGFGGLAPYSNDGVDTDPGTDAGGQLRNFSLPASSEPIRDGATLEFYFRLPVLEPLLRPTLQLLRRRLVPSGAAVELRHPRRGRAAREGDDPEQRDLSRAGREGGSALPARRARAGDGAGVHAGRQPGEDALPRERRMRGTGR